MALLLTLLYFVSTIWIFSYILSFLGLPLFDFNKSTLGLTQINQELKFLAQSSSQLKLTKESLKPTCFNRFKL
jgi:hypothetical protein